MEEFWKDIPNYEGLYQVSNLGRIKSLKYNHSNNEQIMKYRGSNKTGLYDKCRKKSKIINKVTGTIIYPASLDEGSRLIGKKHSYLSNCIRKNKFENKEYKWELL